MFVCAREVAFEKPAGYMQVTTCMVAFVRKKKKKNVVGMSL